MLGKKGMYEVILAFFTITVLIAAVLFFLYANTASATVYAQLKRTTQGPAQAVLVKDALYSCHEIDYLVETRFDSPCKADAMLRGYKVTQLALNGCEEKEWDKSRGQYSGRGSVPALPRGDARHAGNLP